MVPRPLAWICSWLVATNWKLTLLVVDTWLQGATAYAETMFVPGIKLTVALQLVQPFAVVALVQLPPFNCSQTFATATLLLALPMMVNTALLQRWPFTGEVMASVGLLTFNATVVNPVLAVKAAQPVVHGR